MVMMILRLRLPTRTRQKPPLRCRNRERPVNVVAEFAVDPSYLSEDCALTDVTLLDNNGSSIAYYGDQDLTNFTIEVPADTDNAKLAGMILKLTVSDDATVKKSGDTDNWPAAGKACGMELDKAATFTVTAENSDKQDYTVIITRAKSSENEITAAVLLNQTGDTTPFAKAQISGTNIIFTLPSDTNKTDLNSIGLKYLKLTYPESATAKWWMRLERTLMAMPMVRLSGATVT